MRNCKGIIVGIFTAILVLIAGCEEEEENAVEVVEETEIVEEVQQADETEADEYWSQPIDSEICKSIGECRDLGDTYGSEHFTSFIPGLKVSNQMSTLQRYTVEDESALVATDWDDEELIIARYEIMDDEFVLTRGEEEDIIKGIADIVYALFDIKKVDLQSLDFREDVYPHVKIHDRILVMPSNLITHWLQPAIVTILVHEYGHLLTINEADLVSSDTCPANPFYFKPDCYNAESYMNLYYQAFWKEFDEQWLYDGYHTVEERIAFLEEHKDSYVSTYASVHPIEDIAESFTHFMLTPYNESPLTVAEEKINFFYQFPELVEYRAFVLKELKDRKDESMSFW